MGVIRLPVWQGAPVYVQAEAVQWLVIKHADDPVGIGPPIAGDGFAQGST